MPKPLILATVVLMAIGVIAAQTTGTVIPVEPEAYAETFSPFQRMQNAHGLPVYVNGDAI